jgi:hypothetical protein
MQEVRLELNLLKVARVLTLYWLVSWAAIPLYFVVTTGADTVLSVQQLAALIGINILLNGSLNQFGIRGMRERATMLESELQISSELQKGTRVCLAVRLTTHG